MALIFRYYCAKTAKIHAWNKLKWYKRPFSFLKQIFSALKNKFSNFDCECVM